MPSQLFTLSAERLSRVAGWQFDLMGDLEELGGRIEMWEDVDPEGLYVMGADFALGIEGRDYDTGTTLRVDVRPYRQVCEAQGHWGPAFERVLFAMGMYYNEAFLLGERQFGLDRLRALLELGYGWMYYDRDEEAKSRKIKDKLGYWRGTHDICVPNLRRAFLHHEIIVRSRPTIDQLRKLQYAPKSTGMDRDAAQDKDLGIKLSGGGSPDLVMDLAYAYHAAGERQHFPKPVPKYKPGSFGDVLKHSDLYEPDQRDRKGWRERRKARR